MAERVGFEPTVRFPVRSLSRRVLSTAQSPLRGRALQFIREVASEATPSSIEMREEQPNFQRQSLPPRGKEGLEKGSGFFG